MGWTGCGPTALSMVAISLTGDGYYVLDPYRPSNCRAWPWDDIESEIRNLWSYEKIST